MKHENYSFGYDLLRVHAGLLHKLIHRRVTVVGFKNIPKNTPVIFAPNHQNALMDAMAVLLSSPHQPTWLARADLFKNKFISRILYFIKMSPVYRIRDGKDNLGKNDEVFELSIRILKNNKSLAVFPEARHTFKRQSAAHKKAVPRIAFMAEERGNFELGINIVPVGLYYDHYNKWNRELMVTFGEPIKMSDYKAMYQENPGAAAIALRNDIYAKLIPLTIHIKSKTHYEDYETLREIYRDESLKKLPTETKIEHEKQFIAKVENWEAENPEKAAGLFLKTSEYRKLLKKQHLDDRSFSGKPSLIKNIANGLLAGFALPLFLYGWLNFFLGFYLPSMLVRKKIKDKVFWATVEYVLWMILIPLFSLIQWGIVWGLTGNFLVSLIYFFTLPIFGKIALNLNDFYVRFIQQIKIANGGQKITDIKNLRKGIVNLMGNIV